MPLLTRLHPWISLLILSFFSALFSISTVWANESLDAFPAPETGYQRHVIRLPVGNYENNLKIELLAGKIEEVDCNATHYTAQLTEKTLEGWGYNYYEVSDLTGPISTKMACPDEEKTLMFVPILSSGSLLEYNSKLPVVVYLPDGLELRWRTWVATPYNTAIME